MTFQGPRPDPKANPLVEHVKDQFITGRTSRRQFLRQATVLGVSLSAAVRFLAACAPADDLNGGAAAEPETGDGPAAAPEATGAPVRGGTYTIDTTVLELDHPHAVANHMVSNVLRQCNEYLTLQGLDGITVPYLLESFEPNDTADVWMLNIRRGVAFTNGDELDADHVLWNFESWLSEDVGSSMLGLISPYLTLGGVEKVNDFTVRLNLERPHVGAAVDLYHYPAHILHRDFEPPNVQAGESVVGTIVGTGPFILEEYSPGEGARVVRNPDYWQIAPDGDPFPYIDEVRWTDLGGEAATRFAALESGQIDSIDTPGPDGLEILGQESGIRIREITSNHCSLFRMRVDVEPFTDKDVRNAFKLLQGRQEMMDTALFGSGVPSPDHHFGPAAPDHVELPVPDQDIERVRQLLENSKVWQAWGDKPIQLTAKGDTRWETVMGEAFQRAAAEVGVNIDLDIRPPSDYWPGWNHYHFGITDWGHRPLNTMLAGLAYTPEALPPDEDSGNWNETRWVNEEFVDLLDRANATPDMDERLEFIQRMQEVQADDGGIGVPFYHNVFEYQKERIKNHVGHPHQFLQITEAWIDDEA